MDPVSNVAMRTALVRMESRNLATDGALYFKS